MPDQPNYWAMRTSRDSEQHREFLRTELMEKGNLRQGWGREDDQDLSLIHAAWENGKPLSDTQQEVSRHKRMWNGGRPDYMCVGDVVLVPNMPEDGHFTLCRVSGDYRFDIDSTMRDFGHVRPVKILTPQGVANENEHVLAGLKGSLRARNRLWNISQYSGCLEKIIELGKQSPKILLHGTTPAGRVESIVTDAIVEPIEELAKSLAKDFSKVLYAKDWEPAIVKPLQPMFPVSVKHTGGPGERGADLEIVISNPFDGGKDWMIPIQVKDHEGEEDAQVAMQLDCAFKSRNTDYQVIAVVLVVTNADASEDLQGRLKDLSEEHHVPFMYCGNKDFMLVLAKGFLKQM